MSETSAARPQSKQAQRGSQDRDDALERAGDPSRRLGYAVVGLSAVAQAAVLPAFARAGGNSRLVALVSDNEPRRRELTAQFGIPHGFGFDELDTCLALPEVGAVYLALAGGHFIEYGIRAARAGVNVVCGSPFAPQLADSQRLVDQCELHRVQLMVGYRMYFEPAIRRAAEWVWAGGLGAPRYFNATFSDRRSAAQIRPLHAEQDEGPLWNIGAQPVHAARALFAAEPTEVSALALASTDARFGSSESAVAATLRFGQESLGTFYCGFDSAASHAVRMVGTLGELTLDNPYDLDRARTLAASGNGAREARRFEVGDPFAAELQYFSDCVLENRAPEPSGNEALKDVRVIEALRASIDLGRPIALEPLEEERNEVIEDPPHIAARLLEVDRKGGSASETRLGLD